MGTDWLVAKNNAESTLSANMTATALTFNVATGEGASFGSSFPMRIAINAEIVEVASRSTDEFTISALANRGLEGTSRVAHYIGDTVQANVFASIVSQIQTRLRTLERLTNALAGGDADGVQPSDGTSNLAVIATTPVSMAVTMGTGAAYVNGFPVYLTVATDSAAISAPVTNPRIDLVQIDADGNVEIVAGTEAGSPSAPSASADAMGVAQIYCRVGMVSIKNTDDSTNGYITDARTYL